jgi:hypothetical protein
MSNVGEHWFWWLLAMACIAWYSTITVWVAVKGVRDLRGMLKRLARGEHPEGE